VQGLSLIVPSFVLPVALSWLIVRADPWTIAKAYVVWIVLLVLTLGVNGTGPFTEGLGWALVFGIFYTTPAVPLICLILKLWTRLRNWLRTPDAASA
jgi:hypothetical protein